MSKISIASVALAICVALGAHVDAAVVTYDFTGSPNSLGLGDGNLGVSSATVTSGGLGMEISGLDEFGAAGILARNDTVGLGVVGEPGTGQESNNVGADNNGGEALTFDFSPNAVAILSTAVFELGSEAGSFNVLADNVLLDTIVWTAANGGGTMTGNSSIDYTFTAPLAARTAQAFTFQAVEDSFRVLSLTVDGVPEPTTLAIGLIGMLGCVATRCRR